MATLRGDDRRTLEDAAAWFTRLKQESVSEKVIDDFLAWRRDPANDAAYAEVEARWRQADRVANDPDLVRLTEAALRKPRFWDVLKRRLSRNLLPLGLVAATLAGALVLLVVQLQPQAYETDVGAQQIVRLSDGSVLRLNTASRVEVRFSQQERRLVLQRGEAFFEVTHDAARRSCARRCALPSAIGTRSGRRGCGPGPATGPGGRRRRRRRPRRGPGAVGWARLPIVPT